MTKVLIENFNTGSGKIEIPRQEIKDYTNEEIVAVVQQVDLEDQSQAVCPPRMVTDHLIIQKVKEESFECRFNSIGLNRPAIVGIEKLKTILTRDKKPAPPLGFLFVNIFLSILGPIILAWEIGLLLNQPIPAKLDRIITFFGPLLIVSVGGTISCFMDFIASIKGKKAIEVEITMPFTGDYQQWDISVNVLLVIQASILFLSPLLVIMLAGISIPLDVFIAIAQVLGVGSLLLLAVVVLFGIAGDFFRVYRKQKQSRTRILNFLARQTQQASMELRSFYLLSYKNVEAHSWVKIDLMAKIFVAISVVSPILSVIVQLWT